MNTAIKEVLKLALEALEHINDRFDLESVAQDATTAITAIKEALAQPEQEPWCMKMNGCKTKCEDCPDEAAKPQRPWVGLTDAEMQALWDRYAHMEMMRAIEAKLKEKNT